jgi:acyl-CoA reductase-like NAD-dependent aldehyde dehydrogenase
MSTERVIVQNGVADKLIKAVTGIVSKLTTTTSPSPSLGPGQIGPLFTPVHAQNVVAMLKGAEQDGAKIITGDLQLDGSVVQPHVVKGVKPGMKIWERESFGPGEILIHGIGWSGTDTGYLVVGFAVVDSVDEAIELANNSDYSLTASIWTKSIDGINIAKRIRAGKIVSVFLVDYLFLEIGTVVINGNTFNTEPSFGNFGLGLVSSYPIHTRLT